MDSDFYSEGIKREQFALARKMGDIFSCASSKYNLLSFASNILSSDTFYEYFTNEALFSQSMWYVLEIMEEELQSHNNLPKKENASYDTDLAYWMGYLLSKWYLVYHIDLTRVKEEHLQWLYDGYDTLHTTEVEYTLDLFLERFPTEEMELSI